jgi:predicted unusual protein kinase regulating ubiquinone biosynthesis (AarF/ABC1/UbiB family)
MLKARPSRCIPLARAKAERDCAGDAIFRFYFQSMTQHRAYNTDPNPANFVFGPSSVTFLDFGRVKRTSTTFAEQWKRMLRATLERNQDDAKRAFVDMGYVKNPATFDFRSVLAICWTWWWPYLVDRPFAFTEAYLRRVWNVFSADTTRGSSDWPADLTFIPLHWIGLAGVLATLRARVPCRDGMVAYLYPGGNAPAPYSDAELRRFGLVEAD